MKKISLLLFALAVSFLAALPAQGGETEHIDLYEVCTGKTELIKLKGKDMKYGWENVLIMKETENNHDRIFSRISFPAGSYDPGSMIRLKQPLGGAGFRQHFKALTPNSCSHIVYDVRFDPDFLFMKGGKLPGLGGGTGNTGGDKPTGFDGFSSRLMWRTSGAGEVYAYMPNNQAWGTSLGRRSWYFARGVWQKIEQRVQLNTPGLADGQVVVWLNGQLVHVESGLTFRHTDNLKIDQVIFETFFGGNDPSWAPPVNTYLDIGNMAVVKCVDN